jgi:flagellar hook-associated protein 2
VSTGAANTGATVNQDSVDGKLTFDPTKLRAALDSDPLSVRKLLGGVSGVGGFPQAFETVLDPLEGVGGILDQRVQESGKELSRIKDQLGDFDDRMTAKQDYYQKQFTALETAMQQSQTVGNSLASFLS